MTLSFKINNQNGNFKLAKINGSYRIGSNSSSNLDIDNYYYDNILLMHFDNDGSGSFIDSSAYQRTISSYGNVVLSNTQSKFGNSSVYFDGSGDYLEVANDSSLDFESEDFTIEYWEYRVGTGTSPVMCRFRAGNGLNPWLVGYNGHGTLQFYMSTNDSGWNMVGALSMGSPIYNIWSHYAVVKEGNTIRTYQNGNQIATTTTNLSTAAGSGPLSIGRYANNSSDYYDGYLDDIRITKGVARYSSNFSVPVAPVPDLGPAPTVPSTPSNLTVSENQGIVSLSWNRPSSPRVVDSRAPITYYGVEYSSDGGSSWTEDSGPFVVESTLNFNSLSDFTNNFTTTEPNYNTYSINNGSLQINCPTQDRISQYYFKQNKNILDFEMRFSHTYQTNRVPSITFYGALGSVQAYYNNYWPDDQGWDSLGRNRNNVIVGVTPAGGSTTWYAHSSPRLDSNGQFDTIKISVDTIAKTATLIINGISNTYNNNMFSGGFQNVYFDPMDMNFCTSYVTFIDYIKYTTDDTSATNRRLYGLSGGSPYLFRTRAQNSVGFGSYSSTANISTLSNAPSGVSAIGDDNQAFVSWTAPTPNNSSTRDYAIQYSADAGSSWTTFSHSPNTNTLSNVTGLSNGSDYLFRVAAVNFAGTGVYSSNSSSINIAPRSDSLYNKTRILLHLDSN